MNDHKKSLKSTAAASVIAISALVGAQSAAAQDRCLKCDFPPASIEPAQIVYDAFLKLGEIHVRPLTAEDMFERLNDVFLKVEIPG